MRHIELRVLCEGQTELYFVTQVLKPHLRQYMVFATAALLWNGQGGIIPWQTLRNSIKNEVGRSRNHQHVREACPHFNEWVTQLERLSEE